MADNRTMTELLQAPTEGYEDAIVIPEIAANNFELKHGLINLVQNKQFFGHDKGNRMLTSAVVAKVSTSSSTPTISFEVAELKDMVRALLLDKKNQSSASAQSPTPAPVKVVEPNCVTFGGAHSYQNWTLPSNTITNLKEELNGITTRSGVAYQGPTIPTLSKVVKQGTEVTKDQVQTPSSQSTAPVQPLVVQSKTQNPVFETVVAPVSAPMPNLKPSIPYPLRRDNERRRMDECLALADLGASINLMPLFMWEGLSFPRLTPTCMTLELVDHLVFKPIGIAKDVLVKVGVFHFPSDFVVIDFEPDPRVPLILRRCFLKSSRALIDVDKGKLTLRIENESITYNLDQTSRYSANYNQMTANKINVIDMACEEYSQEVSPVHCVPKKGGFTVVENEENEFIPTRLVTGWRVCIDYRKLNEATRKDHFSLPFMDQMLERLAENKYYCFLDGFSRCMLAIFHDMVEKTMEVFMDDFLVFGNSFENCLSRLDKMLQRCEDTNLRLNWEKSHFMVKEGIILGHTISKNGIEVDKAKIDVIAKLPHPITVKDCIKAFQTLKKKLTEAPILIAPNWDLPFELMYDAIDFSIGAKNLAADHLSRLENPYENVLDLKEINETFPLETLSMVTFHGDSSAPWFADFANYHAGNFIVKAKALPTNDARVVCKFLKSLFSRFGAPRAIISDRDTYFCNDQFAKVMLKYGVTHRLSTAYHPQTSGQVEDCLDCEVSRALSFSFTRASHPQLHFRNSDCLDCEVSLALSFSFTRASHPQLHFRNP
nr:retrovirus-related Pol polyprotein from transposon 17.6 [Tanacetum cinerariifolium]